MKIKIISHALITILMILWCLSATATADTTWKSIGPFGGSVFTLVIDPINSQTLYSGTNSGVFKSTNGGASWITINSGLTDLSIRSLVIDPTNSQTLYVGTSTGGINKTTNAGESWSAINNGLTNSYSLKVTSLAIDPINNQIIYAATMNGAYKSVNGGATWTVVRAGSVRFVVLDPSDHTVLYTSPYNSYLYKSINGGTSWTKITTGIPTANSITSLQIDPAGNQIMYLGTDGAGIYKTNNSGMTWSTCNIGLTQNIIISLFIDPTDKQTIYAGTNNGGVCKTINGATSWTAINTGLLDRYVSSIAIDPTNSQIIYVGTDGVGVSKTTTGGTSWSAINSGMPNTQIMSVAVDPNNSLTIYAGTYRNGILKTTNGGTLWSIVNNGLLLTNASYESLVIDPSNNQTIYAGANSGGVFKSVNGGESWIVVNNGLTDISVQSLVIDHSNNQTIYAGTNGSGVFKSTNGGTSWIAANSGITGTWGTALVIDQINPQILYTGTNEGVFKSTDSGASWTTIDNELTTTNPQFLAIDPIIHQTLYAGTVGGIFKSTTGGLLWSVVNNGLSSSYIRSLVIDPSDSKTIYAGTDSNGVFKTINGAVTWSPVNVGITNLNIRNLTIDPGNNQTVYAATNGGGIFKAASSDAPTITSPTMVTFTVGTSGSFSVIANGLPSPTFSVFGMLPSGLTFNSTTGVLSGSPTNDSVGTYQLLITATNSMPPDASRGLLVTIQPPTPLGVAIASPSNGSEFSILSYITGIASGTGLSKVEIQVFDGIYYLQTDGTFSTIPAWISATGTASWSLYTSNVVWVDGITYTIHARAVDGGGNTTIYATSTFKMLAASSKAGTTISLNFTPSNLKGGDTTIASGRLIRIPDDGSNLSGLTVKLIITPPSTVADPTPSAIIIPLTTDSNGNYISGTLNLFGVPGVYMTQVRFDGNATLAASFTVPQPLYVNIQSGYAIVVMGKSPDNSLLSLHTNSTDTIIATLKKRGFLDSNITYLKSSATVAVTKQQIQDAITIWARDKLASAPAPLHIIMIDHGNPDRFVLGDVTLTPDDLHGWINTLENDPAVVASGTLSSFNRFVFIGTCYSGSFISKLSKPGRVIFSSAGSDEQSLAGVNVFGVSTGAVYGGEFFIDALFSFLGRGNNFKDSFVQARGALSIRDPRKVGLGLHSGMYDTLAQHPLLDDNGDLTPHYNLDGTGDGTLVGSLFLGEGIKVNALSSPADIIAVTPTSFLAPPTSSQQLWLKVNINSRVARAWAEIRSPNAQTTGGGSGQVIPTLDMIPLIYDGQNWIGNYSNFTASGKYDIFYYTRDNQTDEISPAAHSVIYKQLASNTVPTSFSLISPQDMNTTDATFVFNWQESSDTDGLTYTLLVSTDSGFSNIVHREENIPQAATYVLENTLKDPASVNGGYYCQNGDTYCYWKVQAIDNYGAVTESDTRSFTIVLTSGQANSIVTGTILNNATGIPLSSATIQIGTGANQSLLSGALGVYLFGSPTTGGTSTTTITITATGYKSRTIPISLTGGNVVSTSIVLVPDTKQTLNVTVSGTGIGTVNSVPTGIACAGTGAGCSGPYDTGTFVTLTAFPSSTSLLSNWGGVCSGNNPNCGVTLNADANVTANFMAMPPVKRIGTTAVYFDTLTAAFGLCPTVGGTVFQTMAQEFSGNIIYSCNIDSTLNGGFDGAFAGDGAGMSVIHGVLTVRQGRLTVKNVVVR